MRAIIVGIDKENQYWQNGEEVELIREHPNNSDLIKIGKINWRFTGHLDRKNLKIIKEDN